MDDTKITQENFASLDPAVLLDPAKYSEIESVVLGLDYAGSSDQDAFAESMLEKLNAVIGRLPANQFAKYLGLMRLLKLFGLKYLGDSEIEKFVTEEFLEVYAFRSAVDVRDEIEKIFKANFDSPDIKEHYRNLLLRALSRNSQVLGSAKIRIYISGQEQDVPPTIKNWLADYTSDTHVDPTTKARGAYGQMNYLNHSQNVALLQKEQKELLLEVIQLYDWLQFDRLNYNFRLPNQPEEAGIEENFEKPTSVVPADMVELVNKIRQNRLSTTSQASPAKELPARQISEPARPPLQAPLVVPARPNEAPTLLDIKADIENKKRKAQEEIDRKLDELKRKVGR